MILFNRRRHHHNHRRDRGDGHSNVFSYASDDSDCNRAIGNIDFLADSDVSSL